MPAFKEHGEPVDLSELVAGRRYLVTYLQDPFPSFTGILLRVDAESFLIRVIHHKDYWEGRDISCLLNNKHFFNLDEVMEEEKV